MPLGKPDNGSRIFMSSTELDLGVWKHITKDYRNVEGTFLASAGPQDDIVL
jgi:hypothetical protein